MALATPVDSVVNPNNPAQRYVLWGNGRVDAYGGAPAITDGPRWFDRIDQPVGVAIHITNWTTGAGYILDIQGGFQNFGGAPDVMQTDANQWPVNTLGIVFVDHSRYVDWSWNPHVPNEGYVIDKYGHLFPFGGAPVPARGGNRFATPAVRGFQMFWGSDGAKKAVTLDESGALWLDWSAAAPAYPPPYFGGRDVARDLVITDWTSTKGYVLTGDGATHPFGGAPSAMVAGPYRAGQDVARELQVLSAADPVRFWQIQSGGQQFEYVASTPPTVTAGGLAGSPATTVTDSTRPSLTWSYNDPQGDSQAAWELYVFTQSFVTAHSMADPSVWAADALVAEAGINRTVRGITSPIDLANGTYRMYVRAKDTAGQWSAWSSRGWTQNVPTPATPTGLTATADSGSFSVALSVSATTGGTASRIRFEASDDSGATWAPVVGADAVPIASTVTATDRSLGLGRARMYRAVAYNTAPRVKSAPSGTASAIVTKLAYVLTAVDNAALGGVVPAVDPSEWTRPVTAGVFQGLGADYPTVVSDGRPKARHMTLHLITHNRAEWEIVAALAESDSVLLYRDPFGEVVYCRLVGDWGRRHLPAAALAGEQTPLRHMHATDLPLIEVAPPVTAA